MMFLPLLTISVFTLPEDFASSTLAYIGGVFNDAVVIIAIAIGLPLAFWFIKRVIGLIPKR